MHRCCGWRQRHERERKLGSCFKHLSSKLRAPTVPLYTSHRDRHTMPSVALATKMSVCAQCRPSVCWQGSWHETCTHGEQHFDHVKHHAADSHIYELRHLRARACGEWACPSQPANQHAPSASAQRWEAEPAVRQPKFLQTVAARACPAGLCFALRGAAEQSHPATSAGTARGKWRRVSAARGKGSIAACKAGSLTRFIHSAQTSCDSKRPSSSSPSSSLPANASAPDESQPPSQ